MRCFVITAKNLKGDMVTLHLGDNLTEAKKVWKDLRVNKKSDYLNMWFFTQSEGRVTNWKSIAKVDEAPAKKKKAAKKED